MTTIAWDGKTLAADRRSVYGGCIQETCKVFRAGDCLVAGAGEFSFILAMVDWVRRGRIPEGFPASQRDKDDWQPVMVVDAENRVLIYERTPHGIPWQKPFAAIGSGKPFALAAMHLGRTASEAVAVAAEFDPFTGNGVNTLEHSQ